MSLRIKQFFINHYLAVLFAVVIGFLMILPQILLVIQMGDDYTGVNILATDSESHFLSRFQEITEEDWGLSDAFWPFKKEIPHQRPHLGQVIMYRFGQIFFLNTGQIFLLTKFILPAILFLLIYFFVLLFEKDKRIALSASIGAMLWYGISSWPELRDFLFGGFVVARPSVFSRPVIPVFGIIILFSFLHFLYLSMTQSKKKYFWLSGIFFGLSFYIYFFVWSFLTVFVGIVGLWFLISKNWANLKKVVGIVFLGALISAPYWFNLYRLIDYEFFGSSAEQVGLRFSSSPIFGKYLIIASILFFLGIYFKKIKKENIWFWSSLVISFIVILNQQLITHRIIQPGHYHWYIIRPIVAVIFLWFLLGLLRRYKTFFWLIILFVFLGGFYLLSGQQLFTYYHFKDEVILHSQRYGPVYEWINRNTEKNEMVFAGVLDTEDRYLFSGYTHLDEYIYRNKYLFPYSYDQNKHILFLECRLDGINPKRARELFTGKLKEDVFFKIYDYYYYRLTFLDKGMPTEPVIEGILDEYMDFYQGSLELRFKEYPVDYLIWDEESDPEWDLDNYNFLELIYQNEGIKVYRVI